MERLHDIGIVITSKRHGEHRFIVTILTQKHGVYSGILRVSRKTKFMCEPGTVVDCRWQARLAQHLGIWTLDYVASPLASIFHQPKQLSVALSVLNAACALVKETLPERDPAPAVYDQFYVLLQTFAKEVDPPEATGVTKAQRECAAHALEESWQIQTFQAYCWFEVAVLGAFAVQLDLSQCAAAGQVITDAHSYTDNEIDHKTDSKPEPDDMDLIYVSPKTGRAVSKKAGEPYKEKLLSLPAFMRPSFFTSTKSPPQPVDKHAAKQEVLAALTLTGYFLNKYGFAVHDRSMPLARTALVTTCQQL